MFALYPLELLLVWYLGIEVITVGCLAFSVALGLAGRQGRPGGVGINVWCFPMLYAILGSQVYLEP